MTKIQLLFLFITSQLLITCESVVIRVENLPENCGYSKCTKPDPSKLNVHLVPHTHDDVGWLKTVEQYYYGTNTKYQKAGVQYILDSVVEELIRNKERRFMYVETAFFWKWWMEQDDEQKAIVKELVKTGQLEFVNGGWAMNDEATCTYYSIIDQMTWGHRRLNDTFGQCGVPKVAWHIDPFGHSREQANLFAAMNFDAFFFARQDFQDREQRIRTKTLEHMWQGSDDRGSDGDLFTSMMHLGYGSPPGFHWDLPAGDLADPIIDNVNSEEYNAAQYVEKLVTFAKSYAGAYTTNNLLIPMGSDFQYQDAHVWFKNMDKLIKNVNERSKDVKIFYSTPSCYAKAVHAANRTWSSKRDDFFPYASDEHAYWTGFYTSRPALKRFERVGNNILQICKQIDVLAENNEKYEEKITQLREIMGEFQHHDAVTGTEKQHVADNYAKNLDSGIKSCIDVIEKSYQMKLLTKNPNPNLKLHFCPALNTSSCPITESGTNFTVTIYNPLGHEITGQIFRFPVDSSKFYNVVSSDGKPVAATLVKTPETVQKMPGRTSKATEELVFRAIVPALGFSTYFISATSVKSSHSIIETKSTKIISETLIKSKSFDVVFDSSGLLNHLKLKDGHKVALSSQFAYYKSYQESGGRASGAYAFRPNVDQKALPLGKILDAQLFSSQDSSFGVFEVHQRFDSYISQVVRIDTQTDQIEFDWVVGPIPIEDEQGKEIVVRYITDLSSNRTFFTDANGRQVLKRVWNHRPTWNVSLKEPIAGNYYPVNSRIFLQDNVKGLQLTVLNDRSQGGTSPVDGMLEVMIHRRLYYDDLFGVSEELNEPGVDGKGLVVRGKHVLVVESILKSAARHRELAQQIANEPLVTFSTGLTESEYRSHLRLTFSGLASQLPKNVHLLTLEQWNHDRLLLRLEHFYQKDEDSELSKPVTVNLKKLFYNFEIVSAQELTLSANAPVENKANRLKFKYIPEGKIEEPMKITFDAQKLDVTLSPMEIRTFVLKVKRN